MRNENHIIQCYQRKVAAVFFSEIPSFYTKLFVFLYLVPNLWLSLLGFPVYISLSYSLKSNSLKYKYSLKSDDNSKTFLTLLSFLIYCNISQGRKLFFWEYFRSDDINFVSNDIIDQDKGRHNSYFVVFKKIRLLKCTLI